MAIRSFTLPKIAQTKVLELLSEIPLPQYYRSYDWGNDRWESGFQDIVCLECTMIDAAKRNCITKEHLLQIARWGGHPSQDKITCRDRVNLPLYINGKYANWVEDSPVKGVEYLNPQMRYFGKCTRASCFGCDAVECGAIDKRLCQVFGRGDPASQHLNCCRSKWV